MQCWQLAQDTLFPKSDVREVRAFSFSYLDSVSLRVRDIVFPRETSICSIVHTAVLLLL